MLKIHPSWLPIVEKEAEKPYFKALSQFVHDEYAHCQCYPPASLVFNAFNLCALDELKVVIIGQDPYHEAGQAMGLSFSVPDGVAFPPSLQNIFKEIQIDLGKAIPASGNLTRWARQGVLLLNATLTVRAHEAGSHQRHGWEEFTDAVISGISEATTGTVFMLWGGYARSKSRLINAQKHVIIESVHPSPLSANRGGWFGQKQFSRCNEVLTRIGKQPIDW